MKEHDQRVLFSSESIEWGTPSEVLDLIHSQYPLTLDVCATPGRAAYMASHYYAPAWAQPWAPWFHAFHTGPEIRAFDGLIQPWAADLRTLGGCGFMNPPFGRAIKGWVRKAHEEAQRGGCFVTLLPARTDTSWWHAHCEPVRLGEFPGEVIFWEGRISFIDSEGEKGDAAPFPVALVVFDGRKLTHLKI